MAQAFVFLSDMVLLANKLCILLTQDFLALSNWIISLH